MRVLGVSLVLAVALLAGRSASATSPHGATSLRGARLAALLARIATTAHAPGAVMVADDGRRLWRGTLGISDRRTRAPMRLDKRFRVASITKMLVATVVLQLVGDGKLRLDEPVGRILPGRLFGGELVTVRELLNHTSGVYDGGPLAPVPGTFHYDNTNYVLLGAIVQAVTGKSVKEQLEQRLLRPLHLTGTLWPTTSVPRGAARGYSPAGRDVTVFPTRELDAADALVSSADDLHRFLAALLGGRLLGTAELAAMQTSVAVGRSYVPVDDRYGLGLMGFEAPCGRIWGHRGRISGYTSFVFGTSGGRRTVVVLLDVGRISDATVVRLNPLVFLALCA